MERKWIVGIGEALFDCLPEGKVLGGAPLNFSVHSHQLGKAWGWKSAIASRIGKDSMGDEVQQALTAFGVSIDWLQVDANAETGTVEVALVDGEPHYTIVSDVAWDRMETTPEWIRLAESAAAVCFGSLAQRSDRSKWAIRKFLEGARGATLLFDVNLRAPFWDEEVLLASSRQATMIKCNEEELPILWETFMKEPLSSSWEQAKTIEKLRVHCGVLAWMLTRGSRGCMLACDAGVFEGKAVQAVVRDGADAIGAGDATAAVLVLGTLSQWDPQRIVDVANEVGAWVASCRGATPRIPSHLLESIRRP